MNPEAMFSPPLLDPVQERLYEEMQELSALISNRLEGLRILREEGFTEEEIRAAEEAIWDLQAQLRNLRNEVLYHVARKYNVSLVDAGEAYLAWLHVSPQEREAGAAYRILGWEPRERR